MAFLDLNGLSHFLDKLKTIFARNDGSYSSLTAGNAEQLVSTVGVEDKTPYLLRTTGGSADVGDRVRVSEITGGTVAWNQLAALTSGSWTKTNVSVAIDGNTIKTTVISASSAAKYAQKSLTTGHVYYVYLTAKYGTSEAWAGFKSSNFTTQKKALSASQEAPIVSGGCVYKAKSGDSFAIGAQYNASANGTYQEFENVVLIDLTVMFGSTIADYIYLLETNTEGAGVAWFRKLFPKPYYAYDAGSLLSVKTSAHKEIGFNQWDEQWEANGINPADGTNTNTSNSIRSKNYIPVVPNTVYYFKCASGSNAYVFGYDDSKAFVKQLKDAGNSSYIGNETFTVPDGVYYIRFSYSVTGSVYANDICINLSWDGERDGEYEPYEEHSYALDPDLELHGIPKLDANNNLYYDGDSYAPDGTVTRKYATRAYEAGDATDGSTMITDGTNTVYKLDTPTTESADPYQETQICNDFCTEEFVDERTVPMPVGANALYQANLRAKLEMAPDSPSGDGDYIVRQTDGLNGYVALSSNSTINGLSIRCPACPTDTDGTFVLKATVSSGAVTYAWTAE